MSREKCLPTGLLFLPLTLFSLPGASLQLIPAVAEKDFGALNRDL